MTLTTLNDDGYLAFCESDFVVIPSGVLLGNITGHPVFLHNPTFPHHGTITLAHCTAPRKMYGCDSQVLAQRLRGFHWMTCYGDYQREVGYALKRIPVRWEQVA